MNQTPTRQGRQLLLCMSAALAAPALWAQTAPAPSPAATGAGNKKEEVIELQAISVTGTNIKRMEQEKVLPVTIFSQDAMEVRNAITPVEMLTALPLVTNVPQNESTNGGAGVRGDAATINLRGIGAGNTLVLLNGRRLAPHPITAADNGQNAFATNVNQLPTQGISHIDVLRDGASSIYGSDAVAGVINYIMRQDFRGTDVRVRIGVPEHGAGQSQQGTVTYGTDFAKGKGHYLTTIDFLHREPIYLKDRDFSKSAKHIDVAPAPFNVAGSAFDGTSATGIYQSFRVGAATGTTYFRPLTSTASAPGFTATAPTRAANPEYYFNINDYQMGSPRSNRLNWYNQFELELNDRITFFSDASFYHAVSHLVRQPIALNAPGADLIKVMAADNPYNPYGSRFYSATGAANSDGTARLTGTPQSLTLLTGTLPDVENEHIQVTSGLYRVVGGLRGKIFDTWSWEAGLLYTRANSSDLSRNAIRESGLRDALLKTDATAYNPFNYTFKVVSGAVVPDQAYHNPVANMPFRQIWRHDAFSSIGSGDIRTSGQLFNLWAGPVSLAGGGEFRKEEFIDYRPPFVGLNPASSGLNPDDNDFVTASPKPDSHGDRTVYSAYAETVIPLAAPKNDWPLMKSLEVTSSVRYENYSDFGKTTKPKVGLNWRPSSFIMARASYNKGFTAPNLPTLYAPTQYTVDSQPGTVDLYRNPYTNEGAYVQRNYTTGNPKLQPATSTGKSVGLVLDVPKIKDLSITADYWQIEQQNVINTLNTTQILTNDQTLLTAYVASQLAAGKTIGQIDLGSGTPNYKGSPDVVRNPVTAADQALFNTYNAAHPNAPAGVVGTILSRNAAFVNLAKGYVSGVDLSANYNLPQTSVGRFTLSADWSYLIRSYFTKNIPNAPSVTQERLNVDGTTRWRGTTSLTWRKASWSAGLSAYYIGRYTDSTATTTAAVYTSLGAPTYLSKTLDSGAYAYRYVVHDNVSFNGFLSYRFKSEGPKLLKNTSVRLGVINLTDREPPLVSGNFGYSASVYGGLLAGRTWTLETTKQF